jgi:CheY-like chemotaxis protein
MAKLGRVLVAEDDFLDVLLLQRAFAKAKSAAQLDFVNNGQGVIDYLRGEPPYQHRANLAPPDLLILDLRMPVLDGFDVLAWLDHHPHLRPAQVVVLSSSGFPQDIQRVSALHADHYLVKPTDPAELVLMVKLLEPFWQGLTKVEMVDDKSVALRTSVAQSPLLTGP